MTNILHMRASTISCIILLLQYALLILLQDTIWATDETCKWSKHDVSPEVYYINMDKSGGRRINMAQHLSNVGFNHNRVRGLTPREIYIPEDIESTWRTAHCQLKTTWSPPVKKNIDSTSAYSPYSSFMTALCGRGKKKNNPKELGCTTSHLVAMKKAVYSDSKSRYALIIEDDVQFPFDVDWDALALTAPKDFVILQLFNSNEATMAETWKTYLRNNENLWTVRSAKNFFDFWSTCAYLIDRVAIKPIIDAVVFEVNGWTSFNIIAGINMSPACVPAACCVNGTALENFIHVAPCVWAPRGFQADSYLYAMAKTYMLNIPLIANGVGGNSSTFHQDHVESVHRGAFRRQRKYVNQLLLGEVKLPAFAKPACKPLDISEVRV